jgi:CubicO group peptidase (beta-lactamase class C family)
MRKTNTLAATVLTFIAPALVTAAIRVAPAAAPAPAPAASPATPAEPVSATLTAEDVNAWLDGYIPYALHVGDIAGAVVAVVKDGKVLTERGYGYSDIEKRTPVDPKHTLFRPGSVSKLFTWTAVMQLVEQGKLDLDADVNQYIDFKIPPRDGKPVTMRNIMQHTAGFEEQAKGILSDDPNAPGFEALLKQWVPHRVFAAGSTPAYSNYGASLAGYIVQRVSGEPFNSYIEKHIFAPLDMNRARVRDFQPEFRRQGRARDNEGSLAARGLQLRLPGSVVHARPWNVYRQMKSNPARSTVMQMRARAVPVLLALSSLMMIAPVGLSFADTPAQAKDAQEAKAKPQPAQSAPSAPTAPTAPTAPGKAKPNAAARKAAEARMARCRLHPEICVQ